MIFTQIQFLIDLLPSNGIKGVNSQLPLHQIILPLIDTISVIRHTSCTSSPILGQQHNFGQRGTGGIGVDLLLGRYHHFGNIFGIIPVFVGSLDQNWISDARESVHIERDLTLLSDHPVS